MCGRFTLTSPAQVIAEAFGVDPPIDLQPRYNIAPTQPIAAVRVAHDGGRELATVRFGLVPWWSREMPRSTSLINARVETAAEKPVFRDAFRLRRCLVPASGFYEWQSVARGGARQPFFIRRRDGAPFAIAAVWDRWRSPDGSALESCALLTTAPNSLLEPIHDRMPAIVPPERYADWLATGERDVDALRALLRPSLPEELVAHRVTPWVNDPRHDDPRCQEEAPATFPGPTRTLFE